MCVEVLSIVTLACHPIHNIPRQPERRALGRAQQQTLVKDAVEIDVHTLAGAEIQQNILRVAIPEPDNVPDHRPDCDRPGK